MERIEFTRLDAMMNLAAFFNTHFTMLGIVGEWTYSGLTQDISFGDVGVCRLYDGDSFGLFDTVCSTDIQTVETWMQPIQYLLVVAFFCSLQMFIITNWALANRIAERALPLFALASFVGSLLGWILWVSGHQEDLPDTSRKFYYIGYGLYFTIIASLLSFQVLILSAYRLRQG